MLRTIAATPGRVILKSGDCRKEVEMSRQRTCVIERIMHRIENRIEE